MSWQEFDIHNRLKSCVRSSKYGHDHCWSYGNSISFYVFTPLGCKHAKVEWLSLLLVPRLDSTGGQLPLWLSLVARWGRIRGCRVRGCLRPRLLDGDWRGLTVESVASVPQIKLPAALVLLKPRQTIGRVLASHSHRWPLSTPTPTTRQNHSCKEYYKSSNQFSSFL